MKKYLTWFDKNKEKLICFQLIKTANGYYWFDIKQNLKNKTFKDIIEENTEKFNTSNFFVPFVYFDEEGIFFLEVNVENYGEHYVILINKNIREEYLIYFINNFLIDNPNKELLENVVNKFNINSNLSRGKK